MMGTTASFPERSSTLPSPARGVFVRQSRNFSNSSTLEQNRPSTARRPTTSHQRNYEEDPSAPPCFMTRESTSIVITQKPFFITNEQIDKYVNLENDIKSLKKHQFGQQLLVHAHHLKYLRHKIYTIKKDHERITSTTVISQTEEQVVRQNVFELLRDLSEKSEQEDQNHENRIKTQDLMEGALVCAKQHEDKLDQLVRSLKNGALQLNSLYIQQETLLASMFSNGYTSEREMDLAKGVADNKTQYEILTQTKRNWQIARLLLYHACLQWRLICTLINNIQRTPVQQKGHIHHLGRAILANLKAAMTNINNAHNKVDQINWHYFSEEKLNALKNLPIQIEKAIKDPTMWPIVSPFCNQCYDDAFKLIQWFDNVIDFNLVKRIVDVGVVLRDKELNLRLVRIILLKDQMLTKDDDFDVEEISEDGNFIDAEELRQELAAAEDENLIPVAISNANGETISQVILSTSTTATMTTSTSNSPMHSSSAHSSNVMATQSTLTDILLQIDGVSQTDMMRLLQCEDASVQAAATNSEDQPKAPTLIPLSELAPPPTNEQLFGIVSEIQKRHEQNQREFKKAMDESRTQVEQSLEARLAARRNRRANNQQQQQQQQ